MAEDFHRRRMLDPQGLPVSLMKLVELDQNYARVKLAVGPLCLGLLLC